MASSYLFESLLNFERFIRPGKIRPTPVTTDNIVSSENLPKSAKKLEILCSDSHINRIAQYMTKRMIIMYVK